MIGSYKQFDSQLYAEYDAKARAVVRGALAAEWDIRDNDDKYGPDLIVYRDGKPLYYIEVEVKRVWRNAKFPWDAVQLPERKIKFLSLGLSIEYWILRNDLGAALIIPDYLLDGAAPVEVPNKYNASGELFYQIPVSNCILKELK